MKFFLCLIAKQNVPQCKMDGSLNDKVTIWSQPLATLPRNNSVHYYIIHNQPLLLPALVNYIELWLNPRSADLLVWLQLYLATPWLCCCSLGNVYNSAYYRYACRWRKPSLMTCKFFHCCNLNFNGAWVMWLRVWLLSSTAILLQFAVLQCSKCQTCVYITAQLWAVIPPYYRQWS